MGNAIINIMLSVLIGRLRSAKFSCLTEHLFAVRPNRKFTLCLGIP